MHNYEITQKYGSILEPDKFLTIYRYHVAPLNYLKNTKWQLFSKMRVICSRLRDQKNSFLYLYKFHHKPYQKNIFKASIA